MLGNLASSADIDSPHKHRWENVKWTQLNEEEYYQLASQLFSCLEPSVPLWHLEKYWTVTRD
jgi:hypothetical protein